MRWAWAILAALLCAVVSPTSSLAQSSVQNPVKPPLLTGAEQLSWVRSTSHPELMDFLAEIQARSEHILVRTIGRTSQERPLPVVFLGHPPVSSPVGGADGDKPTILILGSVHGDEPSGREGALQFIRDVTVGDEQDLLEHINVILVPNANPDGSAAGTRSNAEGYDLNRDWIMAETPEVGAILDEVLMRYRPDVFLDVHNGGAFPYHLTYQATLEPAADPDLVAFSRGPIFEYVRSRLDSRGMSMFWYSGPSFDDEDELWRWRTTEPWPRKQHSYGGLQNMITLLFEIPDRHPLEEGATAAREGMLGLAWFVAENSEDVRSVVERARRRTLEEPLDQVYLELEARPYPGSEEFLVADAGGDGNGDAAPSGADAELVEGENWTRYEPARTRAAPWGYVLDAELEHVVELLRRHAVQVERLMDPATVTVERYQVRELRRSAERYQHHHLLHVDVALESGTVTLPSGSFLVRLAQPAGRLIPQLLEPDAVDSLVRWNLFDSVLPQPGDPASFLPLYRLDEHPEVESVLLP